MANWKEKKDLPYANWLVRFFIFLYKLVGIKKIFIILAPVVFFYMLILPSKIKISKNFLSHVAKYNAKIKVNLLTVYKHFYSFALSLIEKVAVLKKDIRIKNINKLGIADYDMIINDVKNGVGFLALCSHLGNTEFLHSVTNLQDDGNDIQKRKVNVLLSKEWSRKFKSILKSIDPNFDLNMVDSEDFGIDTIWLLSEKLQKGEIVGMACDRTLENSSEKIREINFLGEKAVLPYGVFLLSVLLNVPIYYIFILREKDGFDSTKYIFYAHKSKVDISSAVRKNREEKINELISEYVSILEEKVQKYPLQWYNFFNFWK